MCDMLPGKPGGADIIFALTFIFSYNWWYSHIPHHLSTLLHCII